MPQDVDLTTVGGRLRFARSQKRLRQADVAKQLGVDASRLSEWENNVYVPNPDNLDQLSTIYETAYQWLLRGTGNIPQPVSRIREQVEAYLGSSSVTERERRIELFEREMIRLGADDFEADRVRDQIRAFLKSIATGSGGEIDRELDLYLNASLRPWVMSRIDLRQVLERGDKPQQRGKTAEEIQREQNGDEKKPA